GAVPRPPPAADLDRGVEGERLADEPVAQRDEAAGLLLLVPHRVLHGDREPGDGGHVEGAAAQLALLPAAVGQRDRALVAADDEQSDAQGAADLVAGERDQVGADLVGWARDLAP